MHMKRWILPDAVMLHLLLSQIVLGVLSLGLDPDVLVGWHDASGLTFRLSDPAPVTTALQLRRNRGVRCSRFVRRRQHKLNLCATATLHQRCGLGHHNKTSTNTSHLTSHLVRSIARNDKLGYQCAARCPRHAHAPKA